MKKILLLLVITICLTSCVTVIPSPSRITIVEGKPYSQFSIVKVDGIEYLSSPMGGIYPLVKDTCLSK